MDYVLILYVCSVITGSCMESMPMPRAYKTHHECVINGAKKLVNILEDLNKEEMDQAKIYMAYSCVEKPSV
jgi:hypothetical protein